MGPLLWWRLECSAGSAPIGAPWDLLRGTPPWGPSCGGGSSARRAVHPSARRGTFSVGPLHGAPLVVAARVLGGQCTHRRAAGPSPWDPSMGPLLWWRLECSAGSAPIGAPRDLL